MRSGHLKGTLMSLAVLALGAAITVAADQPDQKGHQNRGTMAAKSVPPGQLKKFHVTAYDGKIAPSTLRVQRGDKVQITFVSKDATYSIKFPDFEISNKVSPEKPAVVEFTPTTAGTFEFRCSKSVSFKHWSKNGTLVVN
jgi:heme/copper-type cytochrome/quinol oxidase subunit 2